MFIVNTEIEVNWLLSATNANYVFSDFDVTIKKPDGASEFIQGAILENDFIAPTPETLGSVAYRLNPEMEGVWTVVLHRAFTNDIYGEYFLRISSPDTHVQQTVEL